MSTDFPNAWPNYPCDDNMPDVCDDIIAEATAELMAELTDLLIETPLFKEWALESVKNNTPLEWDDSGLLDYGDLADEVMDEVLDSIKWAQKNNHL